MAGMLVIGSASGMGRAIALAMVREGEAGTVGMVVMADTGVGRTIAVGADLADEARV